MVINCFYDESMEYADIVYIPDSIQYNVGMLQGEFFKWLFDRNNDHKYWIVVNGEKKACKYGIKAFIDWINENIISNHEDESYIIAKDATNWDFDNENLIF